MEELHQLACDALASPLGALGSLQELGVKMRPPVQPSHEEHAVDATAGSKGPFSVTVRCGRLEGGGEGP